MHLTRKAIGERVKDIDVVIEMLDARLPGSSANPLLRELTSGRPSLKILNKQDLADPVRTALWLAHYNAQPDTRAIGLDASVVAPARALIDACRALAPRRGGMVKPLRVLICGIPNVGKSTLINTLMGKRSAKTGDEAGVTRTEQRLALADDFYLFDTPGHAVATHRGAAKRLTTWRPAVRWAATPMTTKWWRWNCWTTSRCRTRPCWPGAIRWVLPSMPGPRPKPRCCSRPSGASAGRWSAAAGWMRRRRPSW